MTGSDTCFTELVGLVLLSLALLISLCINMFFCIKQRTALGRDTEKCCIPHGEEGDRLSEEEGHYFHNINHHEQQENDHNHQDQQENPIYGNIRTDRRGSSEVCYEMMTMQRTRERTKTSEADLNYASLDLKRAKKHKKRPRHQHQGRNSLQDQPLVHPGNAFLEVDTDMDAQLPSRDTSTMVSHSSIYLNSQQIAQEADEMEREREDENWGEIRMEEDRRNGREMEKRIEFSNGNMCAQLLEASEIQANHSDHSFDHDSIL